MWVPKKYCEKDLYDAELREIDEKVFAFEEYRL